MDTPERNQIGSTSVSKFEILIDDSLDSPVFNYINSLSPIKPVKSTHIMQAFNPLSFAALPSVFTSPHISSHKESRFMRRHNNYSDPSEHVLPSDDGNKDCTSEGGVMNVSHLYNNSTRLLENFDSGVSMSNLSIKPLNDHTKSIEELQNLDCYASRPDGNLLTRSVTQVDGVSEFVGPSDLTLSESKKHHENGSSEHRREEMGYDWEALITDGADLLIFASPNGSEAIRLIQKPLELLAGFSPTVMGLQNDSNNMQITQIVHPVDSCGQHEAEEPSAPYSGSCDLDEQQKLDNFTEMPSDCPINCEPISNLHRGMRRRCLDFETVGAHKESLCEGSSCSSMISHVDENPASNNKQLLRSKSIGSSSSYVLNGIGLHLNALATSSKGYKDVNHGNLSYRRQLSLPNSTAIDPSPTTEGESHLALAVSEKDADLSENGIQMDEDASHASPYVFGEDFNQNSPKKKRRREHSGESEACKRCNCKKSKCLKLYCECFAAGVYCIEPCSCQECFNKPIHEDTVLATRKQIESRNPLAFAPKVIRNSDSVPELGDESSKTPASRHKRGCNCKKSSCLKKYCECYQGGVGCSISCRCEGCKNAFGRKDDSTAMELETEQDEEETEAGVKSGLKKPPLGTEIQNNEEQNSGSLLPATPLQICRSMIPLPFTSRTTKLGSSFLIAGSSSGLLYSGQKLEKPSALRPQLKLEDEMPEILRVASSPGVNKTTSPNSKRVSPPHGDFRSSSVALPRTGRKLILQSIPSFPSLTPQH